MTVLHDRLTVSREFNCDVSTVFGLWSDANALARWYVPGDASWECAILAHDFEIGGRKHLSFGPAGEPPYQEDCRYQDIVENERILFSMTVSSPTGRITSSLVTVEFAAGASHTHILMTEQIAILDGGDTVDERRSGWGEVFDRLQAEL